MKLFVWNNVFEQNYGGGCLYVLAQDEDQAREQAKSTVEMAFGCYDKVVRDATTEIQRAPDRVMSGPYAEAYTWAE